MRVVLVVDHAYVSGGLAKVAIDSAIGLKARGHEPIVYAAGGPPAPELAAAGIRVDCLDLPDFVADPDRKGAIWRGISNPAAADGLARLLASLPKRDTLVHVHGWAKALSAAIAGPIRASGLPCLATLHEYFQLCPNGGFYDYRRHEICHRAPLGLSCLATHCDTYTYGHKLWRAGRTAAMRFVHRLPQVARDVAVFHPFQRAIVEPHLPAGTRIHEIANPVEAVPLGPKAAPASGEMIFVGRLSREKGAFLYAEAARQAGLVPVCVGDGPIAGELAARFPEARLLGWHDAAGVRARLRAARALVFPSLWYEGQPLTVLETLAMGTPVIAGDGSAGRESVVDGETGLWFRQGEAGDLARAIRDMADDALVARLSAAAYARYWADPLTLERHCARLEEVYAGLLARASAG